MTTSNCINSIGLILDILAGIILFFFGPPQPSFEEGVALGLEDATVLRNGMTVAQHNEQIRSRRANFLSISRIALVILILGFVLQLIALWI